MCVLQLEEELAVFFFFPVFFFSRRGSYLLNFWTVDNELDFSYIAPRLTT